jgi:hypothetical protein
MDKLFKFSKLYSVYKVFYEVLSKSQSRQQSMVQPLFSLGTAGELQDTSRQTMSNQTGPGLEGRMISLKQKLIDFLPGGIFGHKTTSN